VCVTDVPVGGDDDRTRGRAIGNARHEECFGADDDRSFDLAELNLRALQILRPESGTGDANFASGKGKGRGDRFNARAAIDVFLAEDAVG
jgi:hypothetical protein